MKTWVELREPGNTPERKGAFTTPAQLKAFLIEVLDCRPTALVTVITVHGDQIELQDGPECLEMMDGRQRSRASRHRKSAAEICLALCGMADSFAKTKRSCR